MVAMFSFSGAQPVQRVSFAFDVPVSPQKVTFTFIFVTGVPTALDSTVRAGILHRLQHLIHVG